MKLRKKGFTLAEVLIALVIIGVIAAITIPITIANYQEKERIARVKKVYSTLSNTMTMVRAQGGSPDLVEVRDDNMNDLRNWFDTYIKPNLITTKVCYNTQGCWYKNGVKLLNGNSGYVDNNTGRGWGWTIITVVLNDGTFVSIDPLANGNIRNRYKVNVNNDSGAGLVVVFDINGDRGPNVMGKDIFMSVFTENGFIPAYTNATKTQIDQDCTSSGQGFSCLIKYLSKST